MKNVSRYATSLAVLVSIGLFGCSKNTQMAYQPMPTDAVVEAQTTTTTPIEAEQEAIAGVIDEVEIPAEAVKESVSYGEPVAKIKPVIAPKIAEKSTKSIAYGTPSKANTSNEVQKTSHLKKYIKTNKPESTNKTMLSTYTKLGLVLLIVGLVLALAVSSIVGLILIIAGLIFILLDIL